jgi:isopenicillin-N epimerase
MFGRPMLRHWPLDPEVLYLNHGTVGSPPLRVLEAQRTIQREIERQPSRYLLRELADLGMAAFRGERPRLRIAADAVASLLGARGEDLVFVDNATTGVNAVLRSIALRPGDAILSTNLAYGAVANVAAFVARERGARVDVIDVPYPPRSPEEIVDALAGAIRPETRVLVVDHVTSDTALVLPIAALAARCREKGVGVLVDGAHAPGAIPVDIPALGVDWYTGNLHKWAWAPRSSGILWARADRQPGLHPPVISWGLDRGFAAEFDWVGTRDPSPHLAAPEGIAFMRELGLEAVRAWNHDLAWRAAALLTERWHTEQPIAESFVGTMATVPLPARLGTTREDAMRLRDALLLEDRIEVQLHAWRERLWVRISAQVYNELGDYERLAEAVEKRA